ncbi:MAG: MBL fold metallo-hydrolase [Leucobacter sp.]|jgi:glyoxylase-like metal-dependent hydrolase (beta-lactamase superfamily II)|nr:MBL fold metallo-hydrolase [Leucobacter sp.]
MRSFRLSHAGIVLELDGASLFIDPGNFSSSDELATALNTSGPVSAIVITHEHADHWTPDNVNAIRAHSPETPIFTTAATAAALERNGISSATVVRESDQVVAGPFTLDFYGRRHEVLHSSIEVIDNVGVLVNDFFAWGGDCLTRPPFVADVLGVPIGSPWSNIAQVMDFVLHSAPRRAFLTHDGMLSPQGLNLFTQRVQWCLDQYGGELIELPMLDEDHTARLMLSPSR